MKLPTDLQIDYIKDLASELEMSQQPLENFNTRYRALFTHFSENTLRQYVLKYGRIYWYQGAWESYTDFDRPSRMKLEEYSTTEDAQPLTDWDLQLV